MEQHSMTYVWKCKRTCSGAWRMCGSARERAAEHDVCVEVQGNVQRSMTYVWKCKRTNVNIPPHPTPPPPPHPPPHPKHPHAHGLLLVLTPLTSFNILFLVYSYLLYLLYEIIMRSHLPWCCQDRDAQALARFKAALAGQGGEVPWRRVRISWDLMGV